jgi:hypothetical protein
MSGSNPTPEATTDAHVRVYRLGYGQWQCGHCGSRFAAMAGCQDCRKNGPEVDELVEQRRAIVERVRPLLDASHAAEPLVLTEVWGGFSRWMDQLYDALTIIGEQGADGEEKLSHALTDMTRMRSAAAVTPRRRPFVAVWLLVDRLLEHLDGVARANLAALEAPTPDAAEGHHATAQHHTDAAGDSAQECGRLLERLGMPAPGSFFDAFTRGTEDAFRAADAQGLTDFDAKGAALYQRITGGGEYPRGLGVSLMLIEANIREAFDADRFEREVRAAFLAFTERTQPLDGLIADPEWRKNVQRASRELFSASVEIFDQTRGSIQNEWFETRALLRLSLLLAEGVAPIYLGTLLALRRRRDWKQYRGADVGQLLKEARDAGLGDLTTGIDIGIRDADAHRAYEQLAEGIALTGRRQVLGRELSGEELLDLALTATESCLLLHTALTCAMTARGVPVEELDAASDLIPKEEQVRMLMSTAGLTNVSTETVGNTLNILGSGYLDAPLVLSAAAAVEATGLDGIDKLEFVIQNVDGTEWRAIGPLNPFGTARISSGIAKEAATVEAAARWRVRGELVFSGAYVRHWAAIRMGMTLKGDLRVTLAVVAALAGMADCIGDTKLRQTLEAYGRLAGARLARLPPPKKDAWASEQIVKWLNDTDSSPPNGPLTA